MIFKNTIPFGYYEITTEPLGFWGKLRSILPYRKGDIAKIKTKIKSNRDIDEKHHLLIYYRTKSKELEKLDKVEKDSLLSVSKKGEDGILKMLAKI